jgi:hypothetical protein
MYRFEGMRPIPKNVDDLLASMSCFKLHVAVHSGSVQGLGYPGSLPSRKTLGDPALQAREPFPGKSGLLSRKRWFANSAFSRRIGPLCQVEVASLK